MTDVNRILSDPDLKHIYDKMLEYLGQGDMAEKRLVSRIERLRIRYPKTARYEHYTAAYAWKVIPLLREQDYINEERYAQRLFNALKDKRDGLRALRRKMLRRDIQQEVVDRIIRSFEESGAEQDLAKIITAAREKLRALKEKYGADPVKKHHIRSKLYAWIAMRGYSSEDFAKIWEKISDS